MTLVSLSDLRTGFWYALEKLAEHLPALMVDACLIEIGSYTLSLFFIIVLSIYRLTLSGSNLGPIDLQFKGHIFSSRRLGSYGFSMMIGFFICLECTTLNIF